MSRQGEDLRRKLATELAGVKAELAVAIAGHLDDEMPVDTGWALANTIPSVGAPVTDPVGSREAVPAGTSTAGLTEVLSNRDPDVDIFVSNAVPYVAVLDAEHPTAAGMVQRAIDKGQAEVGARVTARRVEL